MNNRCSVCGPKQWGCPPPLLSSNPHPGFFDPTPGRAPKPPKRPLFGPPPDLPPICSKGVITIWIFGKSGD